MLETRNVIAMHQRYQLNVTYSEGGRYKTLKSLQSCGRSQSLLWVKTWVQGAICLFTKHSHNKVEQKCCTLDDMGT